MIANHRETRYPARGEPSMTESHSTVMPAIRYRDAGAAIEWLCTVFGFERHVVIPGPENTIVHAELRLDGGMIMLGSSRDDEYGRGFKPPSELGGIETRSAYVIVADADAAYARAKAAGGAIVREIQNTDYGSRDFTVKDPEGHSWSVGTFNPWTAQS